MSNVLLAAAGVTIFMMTAWATLVFGYQAFQKMWDEDQTDGSTAARLPGDDRSLPLPGVDATDGDAGRPSALIHPPAPPA